MDHGLTHRCAPPCHLALGSSRLPRVIRIPQKIRALENWYVRIIRNQRLNLGEIIIRWATNISTLRLPHDMRFDRQFRASFNRRSASREFDAPTTCTVTNPHDSTISLVVAKSLGSPGEPSELRQKPSLAVHYSASVQQSSHLGPAVNRHQMDLHARSPSALLRNTIAHRHI